MVRSRRDTPADEVVTADLTAPLDARALEGIDVVYHLAAKTHDTREASGAEAGYHRINVDATRALVDAAVRQRVPRFVFVSSVKAMDEGGDELRDESRPPSPATAYGRTKLAAERLVFEAAARGGVAAVCVRFPHGLRARTTRNLANMIRAIDRGRFPPPPDTRQSPYHAARRECRRGPNAGGPPRCRARPDLHRGRRASVFDARDLRLDSRRARQAG